MYLFEFIYICCRLWTDLAIWSELRTFFFLNALLRMLNLSSKCYWALRPQTYTFHRQQFFCIIFHFAPFFPVFFLLQLLDFFNFSTKGEKCHNYFFFIICHCKECRNICSMFVLLFYARPDQTKWPLEFFIHSIWWKSQCSVQRFSLSFVEKSNLCFCL